MSNVLVNCPIDGCVYSTGEVSEAIAVALLNTHALSHQNNPGIRSMASGGPKLERPKVDTGISLEEWNMFVRRWNVFMSGSNIHTSAAAPQLFQCASEELGDALLKVNLDITTQSMDTLMATMKALAVVPTAIGVIRSDLLEMKQKRGELFRSFSARVRGKAETCAFQMTSQCSCGSQNLVDYTDQMIKDVLIAGIYDSDIRREAMGVEDIIAKPINEVIHLVEKKEMARDANMVNVSAAGISRGRQGGNVFHNTRSGPLSPPPGITDTPTPNRDQVAPCPSCNTSFHLFSEGVRGWNTTPHSICKACFLAKRSKKGFRRGSKQTSPSVSGIHNSNGDSLDVVSQISAITPSTEESCIAVLESTSSSSIKYGRSQPHKVDHHIFTAGEWRQARFLEHPTMTFRLSVDSRDYKAFSFPAPSISPVEIVGKLDSCAQSCLWSLADCIKAGFSKQDLIPVTFSLSAANKSCIDVVGALLVRLEGTLSNGQLISCACMVYVSPDAEGFYLSLEAMVDLGLINRSSVLFPAGLQTRRISTVNSSLRTEESSCHSLDNPHSVCDCPKRVGAPIRPTALPFDPIPANNSAMKEWLLKTFASSTFNTCPHQPLPNMQGPEMRIHVDPAAKPKACHTPASIPLHWQEQVHADLLRDEAIGVVEKVPFGEPVDWCHRMVITRKHDGSPRRTVDLSSLNRHCKRETFSMESPFHIVRRIPTHTWKSVTDAWNGYHGVPLHEGDKHLTTFITPYGRWRYTRAPQGLISSGDGYNQRFDSILSDFQSKERCVDDICHFDRDLQDHWWRTIDLLITLANAGVILNPSKFQFAERTVDFAGFRVSESSIEPLPKYLDTIRDFPTPKNISDVRSWFGLVNQVSNYAQLSGIMAPFRHLLSPNNQFNWTEELDRSFRASKEAIISAIYKGVEIFDINKPTCLRTDWSGQGVGYFLSQKHCDCISDLPDCCDSGWKATLVGSRFLHGSEQRYAAIEGEALAIAWSLEQTRYFTLGCDDLLVVTDQKPLVKIFSDRALDEITNTRLFRLRQRTLPWYFRIDHMPGATNKAADAASRYPSGALTPESHELFTDQDVIEHAFNNAISHDASELTTIPWADIALHTSNDPCLCEVISLVINGFPSSYIDVSDVVKPFWNIRSSLAVADGNVLLYGDRVVIPSSLRKKVLQTLHAAHQGTCTMLMRAQTILFWPGLCADIQTIRDECEDCCRNAPSQPAMCAQPTPDIPSSPFESVFADFFDVSKHHFLIVGDRLSGWVEVFSSKVGSSRAGSRGLVAHLRSVFATFGVPHTISTDGGPEFTASETENFLKKWGIHHRVSSAHFPQSNGRAEVAVKKVKRFLSSCISSSGSIDTDKFLLGMLQIRNTPDPDCKFSPAEILFGKTLRDAFAFVNRRDKFDNPAIRPVWREAWKAKETALRTRFTKSVENLNLHAHDLPELHVGCHVFVQNQIGQHPGKWDRSGVIVERNDHDQYLVKLDGTGRLTLRNRRFLRRYTLPTYPSHVSSSGGQSESFLEPSTYAGALDTFASPPLVTPDSVTVTPLRPYYGTEPHTGQPMRGSPVALGTPSAQDTSPEAVECQIPDLQVGRDLIDHGVVVSSAPEAIKDVGSESLGASTNLKRSRKPPKRYVPESGSWE